VAGQGLRRAVKSTGQLVDPGGEKALRIVWISHTGSLLGGAQRSMLEAVPGLIEKGVEVHAVLPSTGELADEFKRLGIPIHIIPYTWWVRDKYRGKAFNRLKRLVRNVYLAKQLSEFLKKTAPDVVVSNTLTIPTGAFAAKWAGFPHVWYVQEMFGQQGHGLYFDLGESLSLSLMNKLSALIVVNSKAVLENLKSHIPPTKLRLVYYAVEVPQQPARLEGESRTLRLIQVGNFTPGKRQAEAIRALAGLVKKGLKVHLTLLGSDNSDYGGKVRDLSRDLGVSQHVDFVAFTNDPFPHVAKADIALMCSRGEAFGRVTVEAMKLGKPVVGANSAGTAELISDGATGLIFQTSDPEDLERKIEVLYNDRRLLKQMGRNAQAWAMQQFSRENYVSGLLEIFQEATYRNLR
jgi:glycosyltransferase involved in cell wall biosynthesis